MESKRFIKKIEDFTCDQCGYFVTGDGFTNHCSQCLYSKHVDKNPGDRREGCRGLMKPSEVIYDSKGWIIVHECERCHVKRRKRALPSDNFEALLVVTKQMNSSY
jgi:hypothetical protein